MNDDSESRAPALVKDQIPPALPTGRTELCSRLGKGTCARSIWTKGGRGLKRRRWASEERRCPIPSRSMTEYNGTWNLAKNDGSTYRSQLLKDEHTVPSSFSYVASLSEIKRTSFLSVKSSVGKT